MQARLLDLTRLMSRLGRGPLTGIDRVEFAYLEHLLRLDAPLFALLRTGAGFLLLDRPGAAQFTALVQGGALRKADLLSRLTNRRDPQRARAESTVRKFAIARCARPFLGRMLRRYLPGGGSYLNLGHTNLSVLAALKRVPGLRLVVMVHDTIPLDHPGYARPDTVRPFRQKMAQVATHADLLIHTTHDARRKTEAQLARLGRVPAGVVANLGVELPAPDASALPRNLDTSPPYFVTLGTIEPRKNHALLLDVWDRLMVGPSPVPKLIILGSRGWSNAPVFARLDALPPDHPVKELRGLSDAAVAALLQGAAGFLFPSFAEGFGLPPLEAAALGCPVVASDLAVTKELLGDYAVYLEPSDSYSWLETIGRLAAEQDGAGRETQRRLPPTWADHFKIVLSLA